LVEEANNLDGIEERVKPARDTVDRPGCGILAL
jgi:hypothetical protein